MSSFWPNGDRVLEQEIPLDDAAYYFHQVTDAMMESPGFSPAISRAFTRVFYDDWYKEKHVAFCAFDNQLFAILTSYLEFSPGDISGEDLKKIFHICQQNACFACGYPPEIDLDRLYKYRIDA